MAFNPKKIALTAFNRNNSGVNAIEPKKTAFTVFNRENNGVNGVEPEKQRRQWLFTEKIAALRALNTKKLGYRP